ncbi:zinc finger protein 708-like isoform X2 [Limulus polyphemus]|uniref:Zinc finger protein 708-like isoform X2 n=1 Tax=Limulus polyphemus TaxID=6850 RepID=A0ABM1TNG1_LIMPO|nr:zinc finger protein 708-like isoform X2 [Limulus polyphemus]
MKFALIYFFHNNAIEICRSDSILGYENEENPLIRVNEIVRVWCRPRQKRKSSSNTNSNSSLEAENNKCVELDINTTTSSNSTSNVRIENVSTFAAKVLAVADTREVLLHVDVSEDILGGGALSGSIDESCKKKTCLDEDISERKLDTKYDLKDIKVEIETKYACDNSFKTNLLSNSVYEIFDSGEENLRSGALSGSTDEACKKETCLDEDTSERKLDTKYDLKDLKVEIETKYACDNSFKTNLLSNSVCEIFDSKEENSDSKSMMEIVKTEESCVSALSQDEVLHKKEETETTKDKESAADSFISRKRCKESRIQTMFMKEGKKKTSHGEEPTMQSSVSKTQTSIQLLREKEDARDCSNKTSVSMNDTNKTEGRKLRTRHKVYTENKSDDEEERLSCGECGKDYKNKKQLRRHLLIHKRTKLLSCGEEERLKCDECGKDYKNKKQLKRHLLIHKRTKLLSCGEEERLKCDECGKDFINKKSLWNHQLIHRKSKLFSCNVCGRAFKLLPYLKNHSVIHRKKKPYCCDVCGRRFAQKFALISHRKIHTGEKPYECNICHKKFRQNTNLKCHIMIHTGEKPYSCNVCDKAYRSHSHLKSHKLTHKGEKPFKCDVCGKKFTRVFVLRQHQLVHTGEKPYGCDVCKKTFRQKAHLRSHLLRHKNEK